MEDRARTVKSSVTEQVHILMPGDINGSGRLFGGQLMQWIDVVAGVVARRHCGRNVTTAAVDNLQFKEGAFNNDTMVLDGRMTYVGNSSMEVRVDSFVEELDGTKKLVNRAYLVLVALDEDGKPVRAPRLILESDEERTEFAAGERRSKLRKQRLHEQY